MPASGVVAAHIGFVKRHRAVFPFVPFRIVPERKAAIHTVEQTAEQADFIYCETLTSGKPKKRRLPPSTFLTFILNSANRFRRQLPEPPTRALLTSLGTH